MARLFIWPVLEWRVVDGDSLWTKIDRGFRDYKDINVRVNGINTPEKTGDEKTAGLPVRDVVVMWLNEYSEEGRTTPMHVGYADKGRRLFVHSLGLDKYGRVLGDVLGLSKHDGEEYSLSSYLLMQKLAQKYSGGTKVPFTEDELVSIREKSLQIMGMLDG